MSAVIELADRALAVAREGVLLEVAPSVVRAAAARDVAAGESMLGRERIAPTEVSTDHWSRLARGGADAGSAGGTAVEDPAALRTAGAELAARASRAGLADGCTVEMLTAAPFDGRNLGAVLALAGAAGLRVGAFRDAAVVTAAALDLARDALVVELGLHHAAVTRVSRGADGWARSGQRLAWQAGGSVELRQHWLTLAAEAFVLRTRFDPLHAARTEQQLHDALPAALSQAASAGRAVLQIAGPGDSPLAVELTRDQLALPAQAFMRSLLQQMHALRPAGAAVTLVLPQALAQSPGIDAVLAEFQGCDWLATPDGFAAQAWSAALATGAWPSAMAAADGAVRLLRRVGAPQGPAQPKPSLHTARIGAAAPQAAPSHLLYAGRALAITTRPLEIGRGPGSAGMLGLPEGLAGVSRLHCTVQREGVQVVLVDHSRHGSFVNGERVAGRALLRAGDTLRVGDPGIEFAMIAVGDSHAPPPPN